MFLSSDHFHGLVSCTVFTVSPLVQSWLVVYGCVGGFDKSGGRGGVGTHVRLRVCGTYHACTQCNRCRDTDYIFVFCNMRMPLVCRDDFGS